MCVNSMRFPHSTKCVKALFHKADGRLPKILRILYFAFKNLTNATTDGQIDALQIIRVSTQFLISDSAFYLSLFLRSLLLMP